MEESPWAPGSWSHASLCVQLWVQRHHIGSLRVSTVGVFTRGNRQTLHLTPSASASLCFSFSFFILLESHFTTAEGMSAPPPASWRSWWLSGKEGLSGIQNRQLKSRDKVNSLRAAGRQSVDGGGEGPSREKGNASQ